MDKAEFDQFAASYHATHSKNIAATGETPEFFSEYKIADLATIAQLEGVTARHILDFGSGIGGSVPWFRKYFPEAELTCSDISARSLQLSQQRFPGTETYVKIHSDNLPLPMSTFDLLFSACVFHHISHAEHIRWLKELFRVTKPNGLLVIFEHNPWNPLTVRAVNTCSFDKNAHLIDSSALKVSAEAAGWTITKTWYRIFFPRFLASLRPLEKYIRSLKFGAQYCIIGRKFSQ